MIELRAENCELKSENRALLDFKYNKQDPMEQVLSDTDHDECELLIFYSRSLDYNCCLQHRVGTEPQP